jgi:hypothetical protein
MNKVLLGLAVLPFMAGAASAGQPLSDTQMDRVTAGHTALASSVATALGSSVATQTLDLAVVARIATATSPGVGGSVGTPGETTISLFESAAEGVSSSVAAGPSSPLPIPT